MSTKTAWPRMLALTLAAIAAVLIPAPALALEAPSSPPAEAETSVPVPARGDENDLPLSAGEGASSGPADETLDAEEAGGLPDPEPEPALQSSALCPALDGDYESAPFLYSSDVVQMRMAAMEDTYYTGYPWNDYSYYYSPVLGGASACVGFAYLISDAGFGDLPARTLYRGSYTYDDIQVGDILWVDGGYSHMVVILEKYDDHVLLVEGNFWQPGFSGYGVNWRRSKTRDQVMTEYRIRITRYPVHLTGDVNGSKRIDAWDAADLLLYLIGDRSGQDTAAADANRDGLIDAADVSCILRMDAMKQDGLAMRPTAQ